MRKEMKESAEEIFFSKNKFNASCYNSHMGLESRVGMCLEERGENFSFMLMMI